MKMFITKKYVARSIKLLLATIMLWALMPSPTAFALQRDSFPVPGDYALEYCAANGETRYLHVTAVRGGSETFYNLKRIPNWQRLLKQTRMPSDILLNCRREGDAIKAELSFLLRPAKESSGQGAVVCSVSNQDINWQLIGSYSARLGESIQLKELADYGIEPFSLKVVSANARRGDPSEIGNRTKAIEVVRVDWARNNYLLALKNISSKRIVACFPEKFNGSSEFSIPTFSLVPGEVKDYGVLFYGNVKDPQSSVLVTITDVVFEDWTYEGSKDKALLVASWIQALKVQRTRIAKLLQMAGETYEQDSQQALAKLRQQVSELSVEADSQVIEEVAGHFLPLSEKERTELTRRLNDEMKGHRDVDNIKVLRNHRRRIKRE